VVSLKKQASGLKKFLNYLVVTVKRRPTMSKLFINKEPVEIFDLVNQINNEQIVELLECIFYNRPTEVFVGMYPKGILRSVEIDKEVPVCLNGTIIQINTEHSFTDQPIDWESDND
jgi:hypothetical protein